MFTYLQNLQQVANCCNSVVLAIPEFFLYKVLESSNAYSGRFISRA